MSEPTQGERALAGRLGIEASQVASARNALNAIALLPWPEPERVSLLARLARAARADVGAVIARIALRAAPLGSFDQLIPLALLADKRAAGLVRALGDVDVASFTPEAAGVQTLRAQLQALQSENAALRSELDFWRAKANDAPTPELRPTVMRLGDVASSVANQAAQTVEALRTRARGLRLVGLDLRLEAAATAIGEDLALDFAALPTGSAVNFSFTDGDTATPKPFAEVPDVIGYTPALAKRKLAASGLEAKIAILAGAVGGIAEQSPSAGERVPRGAVVRLTVR